MKIKNSNKVKTELLGMPFGTAASQLRKMLLFELVKKVGADSCYRCGKKIESITEFSIEHTVSWQYSKTPKETFFDLSKIAYSHLVCNISAPRQMPELHNKYGYSKGCRCLTCTEAHAEDMRNWRSK